MSNWKRAAAVLAAAFCWGAVQAQTPAAPPPLPAEVFFRQADIEQAALSPSGRWLAVTARAEGARMSLVLIDAATGAPAAVLAKHDAADVDDFYWVTDDWLVYDLADRSRGQTALWPGVFGVSRDGKDRRMLVARGTGDLFYSMARDKTPLHPRHLILQVNSGSGEVILGEYMYGASGEFQTVIPKRVEVATGRVRPLVTSGAPPNAWRWTFDPDGAPRAVLTRRGATAALHWRAPGQEAWQRLFESDWFEQPYQVESVDAEGRLYVRETDASGFQVLKRFDFTKGRPEDQPIVTTPGFDFQGSVVSEVASGRSLGVRVQVDAEVTSWFDPRLRALQQEADKRLPGRVNRLSCRRCDAPDMTVLVYSYADRDPGQYWLHTAADGQWRKITDRRRGIDMRRMASTDFERVKTRDGLEQPVWITRPAGIKGALPTVVLVHGGPWLRGRHWQWDAMAQFIASRGYLVLEPEFRGSVGYGTHWHRAGWKQWGRAMQDDVADALEWAVKQGHADPKRACIAGASYGGYSALMGLIRHPELYRCGVAWVAVTDPRLMLEWRFDSDMGEVAREVDLPRMLGDPSDDAAMLDSVSPVLRAAEIKAPVLLAVGGVDARVLPEHAERLRKAMREAGRVPQFVEYPDEGHTWLQLKTHLDFAARLERFLAEHLKP